MSATDNAKPPRPCTEYNIFFQLERAYILQVLLQAESTINDATDVFHPSQASYVGLPALPRRYASLILPYDWHLPGKEQRRKRKHRKSHGAIGFHELSTKIVNAWKIVDEEVKTYCSQVCAVGLARYKDAVKEWKRNGGQQQVAPHKKRSNIKSNKALVQDPGEVNSIDMGEKTKKEDVTSTSLDFTALIQNRSQNELPLPTPVTSQEVTSREISQFFENDMVLTGGEEVHDMLDIQVEPLVDAIVPFNTIGVHAQDDSRVMKDIQMEKVMSNASIASDGTVDMDDSEILSMWNSCNDIVSNHQHCYNTTPVISASNTLNISTVQSVDNIKTDKYNSLFGFKGYNQTMQEMQRMKLILDEQVAELSKARGPTRRRSIVACCA